MQTRNALRSLLTALLLSPTPAALAASPPRKAPRVAVVTGKYAPKSLIERFDTTSKWKVTSPGPLPVFPRHSKLEQMVANAHLKLPPEPGMKPTPARDESLAIKTDPVGAVHQVALATSPRRALPLPLPPPPPPGLSTHQARRIESADASAPPTVPGTQVPTFFHVPALVTPPSHENPAVETSVSPVFAEIASAAASH